MKRLLILLAVTAISGLSAAAPAAGTEKEKLVDEFLTVTRQAEQLSSSLSLDNVAKMQQQMIPELLRRQGITLSAEQQRVKDEIMAVAMSVIREEMSWEKLRPAIVKSYAETFSADELKQLIAFFRSPAGQVYIQKTPEVQRSPAGQVYIQKTPEVQRKLIPLLQERAINMQILLQQRIKQRVAELQNDAEKSDATKPAPKKGTGK